MTTLSTPNRQPARTALQGPRIREILAAAGIEATAITRNRRTGVYAAKFSDPNADNFYSRGIDPARVWAERIQEVFPLADIIDGHDSVAGWRDPLNPPVLFATVFFTLPATATAEVA